jgi:predicted nucleic acid-binding protein
MSYKKMIFVVDANIFIDAYKRYYSFDIAPSFWSAVRKKAEAGQVVSIDHIFNEINRFGNEDELKIWANDEFSEWFTSTDSEDVFKAYREVIGWATSQTQFTEAAKAEFASVADSWLIACAKAHNYVLVTHEQFAAEVKRKIPIPNVCNALDIPYINTFEMLRRLKIRLG